MWNLEAASRRLKAVALLAVLAVAAAGCDHGMEDQYKVKAYTPSDFFPDGRSERLPVPGTVARGEARLDSLLYTGKIDGRFADLFPFAVTADVLKRGQERYGIYCSECHDRAGTGNGMIVRRGFPHPEAFGTDHMRGLPAGQLYDAIANGYQRMFPFNAAVDVKDRWAIVAYIRALQLSQDARVSDLPAQDRQALEKQPASVSTDPALEDMASW